MLSIFFLKQPVVSKRLSTALYYGLTYSSNGFSRNIANRPTEARRAEVKSYRNSDTFRGKIVKNKPLFYCCFSNELSIPLLLFISNYRDFCGYLYLSYPYSTIHLKPIGLSHSLKLLVINGIIKITFFGISWCKRDALPTELTALIK